MRSPEGRAHLPCRSEAESGESARTRAPTRATRVTAHMPNVTSAMPASHPSPCDVVCTTPPSCACPGCACALFKQAITVRSRVGLRNDLVRLSAFMMTTRGISHARTGHVQRERSGSPPVDSRPRSLSDFREAVFRVSEAEREDGFVAGQPSDRCQEGFRWLSDRLGRNQRSGGAASRGFGPVYACSATRLRLNSLFTL